MTDYYTMHFWNRLFPIGQWTHVTLTWNEEEGPQIYINGSVVGNSGEQAASVNSSVTYFRVQIGSGFEMDSADRGNFTSLAFQKTQKNIK